MRRSFFLPSSFFTSLRSEMKSSLPMLPGCRRKKARGLLPDGVHMTNPAIVKLFHDPEDWMTGVQPLGAQVRRTTGFSEMPDSSS